MKNKFLKLMILIPGDSVESLTINEMEEEGGQGHEKRATAGCCI